MALTVVTDVRAPNNSGEFLRTFQPGELGSFISTVNVWLKLRHQGREFDGAVALLMGMDLSRNVEPSALAVSGALNCPKPDVEAAMARLVRDGFARS